MHAHTRTHALTLSQIHTLTHTYPHTTSSHTLTTHADITRFLVQSALVAFKLAKEFALWHLPQSVRLVGSYYYAIDRSAGVVR